MVAVSLSKITPRILSNIERRTLPQASRPETLAAVKDNVLTLIVNQRRVFALLNKVEDRISRLSGALSLIRDFPTFNDICVKEFSKPQSLIKELEDFISSQDSQRSLATLMHYYLTFHPKITDRRQWNNAASAVVLYGSSPVWQAFFDMKYEKPADLIAAIPKETTQSTATLMHYYLTFHPKITDSRQWIYAANAIVLYESSPVWQRFFDMKYEKPADLIAAIPKEATQSTATLMTYYLTFHPEINDGRQWVNAANAVVLYESSPKWQIFFDAVYKKAADLIAAIPERASQSAATLTHYYLTFHPEISNGRQWVDAICAVLLALRYPFFIRANSTADLEKIHQKLGLVLKTLRAYKREFNKIDIDMRSFYRLNPALRWWRENPEARERAVEALKQGDSDLNQYPEIAQAIKKTKVSSKTFENYVVTLKRYLEEEIVFWDD